MLSSSYCKHPLCDSCPVPHAGQLQTPSHSLVPNKMLAAYMKKISDLIGQRPGIECELQHILRHKASGSRDDLRKESMRAVERAEAEAVHQYGMSLETHTATQGTDDATATEQSKDMSPRITKGNLSVPSWQWDLTLVTALQFHVPYNFKAVVPP